MSAQRPGVVLDCMVYLQAAANAKSSSARLLDLLDLGEITLYVSRETLREVRETLNDPEIRSRLPGISDVVIEALFRRLERKAILIKQVPRRFEYPRDPKDEPYVNLALAAAATYLVSRDNDLLDLMDWDTDTGREFQKRFKSLRILTPETFLDQTQSRRQS
jgi:putative PIN family toxin of toxin-antitoxin system